MVTGGERWRRAPEVALGEVANGLQGRASCLMVNEGSGSCVVVYILTCFRHLEVKNGRVENYTKISIPFVSRKIGGNACRT